MAAPKRKLEFVRWHLRDARVIRVGLNALHLNCPGNLADAPRSDDHDENTLWTSTLSEAVE